MQGSTGATPEIPERCAVVDKALPASAQPLPTTSRGEMRASPSITFSQPHTRPFLRHHLSGRTAWQGDPEHVLLGFPFLGRHRRVKWYRVRITVSQPWGAQRAPRRWSPIFLILIVIGHGFMSSLLFHVVMICSCRKLEPIYKPIFLQAWRTWSTSLLRWTRSSLRGSVFLNSLLAKHGGGPPCKLPGLQLGSTLT